MAVFNIIFWLVFIFISIWMQYIVAGVDFFLPILLIAFQEARKTQTILLTICAVLIQEGLGSFAFGVELLWYGMLFVCFYFGRWFLGAENTLLVIGISVVLVLFQMLLAGFMPLLQDSYGVYAFHGSESILQFLSFPIFWFILRTIRIRWGLHSHAE